MSRLEELFVELCPDGVPFKPLGELGTFYSGLTGKTKDDFNEGDSKFITYMNVYTNMDLKTNVTEKVKISENEKQNIVQYGDIIFTGSSETPDECGMSSVLTTKTDEKLYLNSFCFGYRFKEPQYFVPAFTKHLFRSNKLRRQIIRTASGVTRFNVSKKKMESVVIPVPPLEVQREIVRVLDNFTFLTAELTAELTARKKQYEYYRNKMIFTEDIPLVELRSVVKSYCAGATPKKGNKLFYENGTIPWIRTQDVRFNEIYEVDSYITEAAVEQTAARWIPENCVIVAISGASAGRCAINKIKATTNQHCLNMVIDDTKALYEYVYYCIAGRYDELISRKQGARGDLNSSLILGITIPVPPLEEQRRIVSLLDKFNKLLSNISIGLPAEIAARQKQYEYYRDKLLTFKELNA